MNTTNSTKPSTTTVPLLILFLLITLTPLCPAESNPKITAITTTTLLETMVTNVGKDKVNVITIIPAGMCPGHFDLSPHHVQTAASADIIFYHDWEIWISTIKSTLEKKNIKTILLETNGNLMVPYNYLNALKIVIEELCFLDPKNKDYYQNNAAHYKSNIMNAITKIKADSVILKNMPVLSSEHQANLLKWLGLKIIATYGRPEDFTPKSIISLVQTGKQNNVQLVVDNLQSTMKAGEEIAREIGCKSVMLTNFPLNGSYIEALQENLNILLKERSQKIEPQKTQRSTENYCHCEHSGGMRNNP